MKKTKKLLSTIALCAVAVLSCGALVACGDDNKKPSDGAEPDDTKIAGVYTLVSGDITYALTIEDNNDFNMTITKDCGTYNIVKTYLGPIHNINGVHCSTMPVFLSSVEYDGTGAPDDQEKLESGVQAVYRQFTAANADGADGRERYITVDIAKKTFSVDAGHSYTTLDYTDGVWTCANVESKGFVYNVDTEEWTYQEAEA